jgi:hypothetical protein
VKIERVQYDGSGEWLDVTFSDGRTARFSAGLVYQLALVMDERRQEVKGNGSATTGTD